MHEIERKIPIYALDPYGNLDINFIFNYLLEISDIHGEKVGYSSQVLEKLKYTWMIYQLKMEIFGLPKKNDKLKIKTWVSSCSKLKSIREVNFYNDEGKILVKTTTVWVLIDTDKQKPSLIPKEIVAVYGVDKNPNFDKLQSFSKVNLGLVGKRLNTYKSDIDTNKHVNSGVYLRWILDSVEKENHLLKSIDVYYKGQTFLGDRVEIRTQERSKGEYIHQINNQEHVSVLAKTSWAE